MKKQILSIAFGLVMMAITTTTYAGNKTPEQARITANKKVVNNFNKQFKNSVDPSIFLTKDGFIVRAMVDDHTVTAAYDKKGNWVYTLKLYPTDNLAKNVVDVVMGSYNNYYITSMEKVDRPGNESVFVVHLQNQDTYKTLRVVDKDVELIEDFKKG